MGKHTPLWFVDLNVHATQAVIQAVNGNFPISSWFEFKTVLAVSGGSDSVAMFRAFEIISRERPSARDQLIVGHIHHSTRPQCDEEEAFVRDMAEKAGVSLEVRRRNSSKSSSEETLRDDRYRLLQEIAEKNSARFIVTAHHQSDQVETVLFRLFRGTGLDGLRGIPSRRRITTDLTLVRPMLDLNKSTILKFLEEIQSPWCEDSSNENLDFSRNYIRHQILPVIAKRFGGQQDDIRKIEDRITRLSEQANESQQFIESLVEPLIEKYVTINKQQLMIQKQPLHGVHRVLLKQLVRQAWASMGWSQQKMTAKKWEQLVDFFTELPDEFQRLNLPNGVDCQVDAKLVVLTEN